MTTGDLRLSAVARIQELVEFLKRQEGAHTGSIIEECEALSRAVSAFHMEAIRFRIYNVDRLLGQHSASLPTEARALLDAVRRDLEAAGFHTRSHQSPI